MIESALTESKSLRFARFLRDYVQMRTTTVRDVDKYSEVIWLGELPNREGCILAARGEQDLEDERAEQGVWIEVHKQQIPDPPIVPGILKPWVDDDVGSRSDGKCPPLKQRGLVPDPDFDTSSGESPPLVMRDLADHPGVQRAYEELVSAWEAWAQRSAGVRSVQNAYTNLFRIHTRLLREGESVELRLALGLLDWPKPRAGGRVRRHVVTTPVELRFDPKKGRIRVECPKEGADLTLETDMLDASVVPGREFQTGVQSQLHDIGDDVWDKPRIEAALQTWARSLHSDGSWSDGFDPTPGDDEKPAMSWAPALVLRSRGQTGMLRVYDTIIQQLDGLSDNATPAGWQALIDDIDDRHDSGRHTDAHTSTGSSQEDRGPHDDEIFFPLPANDEQRRIATTIRERRGVLVQGPPGTGKSHTIANLMCHLLATGQRVLVTAENPRALSVLKDKLPDPLKPLCISVLGQGGDSFAELNATVQNIASRRNRWDRTAATERIGELRKALAKARTERSRLDRELREHREAEVVRSEPVPGYEGTASQIAKRVAEERDRFGWLGLDDSDAPSSPITNEEAVAWLEATLARDERALDEAGGHRPAADSLPAPSELTALFSDDKDLQQRLASYEGEIRRDEFEALSTRPCVELDGLVEAARDVEQARSRLKGATWVDEVVEADRQGDPAAWKALLSASRDELTRVHDLTAQIADREVRIPDNRSAEEIFSDATAAIEYLKGGGKWKGLLGTPKPLKSRRYLIEEVTVDGSAADEIHELEAVAAKCSRVTALDRLDGLWAGKLEVGTGADERIRIAAAEDRAQALAAALDFGVLERELRSRLETACGRPLAAEAMRSDTEAWIRLLSAARLASERRERSAEIHALERRLRDEAALHDANTLVGSLASAVSDRDVTRYGSLLEQLREYERLEEREAMRARVHASLLTAAPHLLSTIESHVEDAEWRRRLELLEEAWAWAAADRWIVHRGDPQRASRLEQKRRAADGDEKRLTSELAAELAWCHFFDRLSPAETNALKSWREAVKQMGKGTSRSAKMERLRREARRYMEACRDAVPVWIMPRYLVAEMIDARPEQFDTVIIDEASQLGVEGLFLFYVAKKMVVVGDDQQISPSGVGIKDDDVEAKRTHWIEDVPHPHMLSPKSSVYSNAHVRFGTNVTLREHFRCMPEIIQFSNDLCYAANDTPLDPLRDYNADRLQPLKHTYVEGGQRTGGTNSAKNDTEAKKLVETLIECLDDPAYADKSFGVISLQGGTQARVIEKMLLERVAPEVFEERRILCGDSYAFQGDERHVIFLSMVAAPGETRISALTSSTFMQRFNVAASRAQDQLWLFHSLQPSDLKPECLRYKLIDYIRSPFRRQQDPTEAKFDSPFERAVYDRVSSRGYRVVTQVGVGNPSIHYRIDLVVEGLASKLAVECDGDRWHGPERYEADMARQRDLERVGWDFVRIPGSAFYREPDAALHPLWKELERKQIFPRSGDDVAATSDESGPSGATEVVEQGDSALPRETSGATDEQEYEETGVAERLPEEVNGPVPPYFSVAQTDETASSIRRTESNADVPSGNHQAEVTEPSLIDDDRKNVDFLDPRDADPGELRRAVVEIVRRHGPLQRSFVFARYREACGARKMGKHQRSALENALSSAERSGVVVLEKEGRHRRDDRIVRIAGTPPVQPRPAGDREFEEIPPSEYAAAMLLTAPVLVDELRDIIYRRILAEYGFSSTLTQNRRETLDIAWNIALAEKQAPGSAGQ